MTVSQRQSCLQDGEDEKLTMQRHNAENEPQRQHQHHDRIDLQPRRLIRIQPYRPPPTTSAHLSPSPLCLPHHSLFTPPPPSPPPRPKTPLTNPLPSFPPPPPKNNHSLNIVLLLPPAPAARVLLGLAFATLSARSAAALRRIAVFGPPGGVGEDGRPVLEPVLGAAVAGESGRGED